MHFVFVKARPLIVLFLIQHRLQIVNKGFYLILSYLSPCRCDWSHGLISLLSIDINFGPDAVLPLVRASLALHLPTATTTGPNCRRELCLDCRIIIRESFILSLPLLSGLADSTSRGKGINCVASVSRDRFSIRHQLCSFSAKGERELL